MDFQKIFNEIKSIAVVGISNKPSRDSGRIASFLLKKGYNVVGVHPALNSINGIKIYSKLSEIPTRIDLVDVFINGQELEKIKEEIIVINPKYVWFQYGVKNDIVANFFKQKGIQVIEDRCIAVELSKYNR